MRVILAICITTVHPTRRATAQLGLHARLPRGREAGQCFRATMQDLSYFSKVGLAYWRI